MTSQEQPGSSSPPSFPFITLFLWLVFKELSNSSPLSPSRVLPASCCSALVACTRRLGTFLAKRALKAGATWVFVVGLPSNLVPASAHPSLRARNYAALALAFASFALEMTADYQKSAWRRTRDSGKYNEKSIASGLWAWSRHPNYVGEAVLLSAASPIGTYSLLRYASGVPPLDCASDKKFGDDPKWKEYKRYALFSLSFPSFSLTYLGVHKVRSRVFFPWGGYA
ncbi:hypothetical protein OG21DRAFT_1482493 [Imleria badia]|nr:hypothetical protein OG21DRAFT_1482493 [Imleria badia]